MLDIELPVCGFSPTTTHTAAFAIRASLFPVASTGLPFLSVSTLSPWELSPQGTDLARPFCTSRHISIEILSMRLSSYDSEVKMEWKGWLDGTWRSPRRRRP